MNTQQLLQYLRNDPAFMQNVTNWEVLPARPAEYADFGDSLDPRLVQILQKKGIGSLYTHQKQALDLANAGKDFVVITPTTSDLRARFGWRTPIATHRSFLPSPVRS